MDLQNPKDLLFYQLLCDLSQDIISDTQSAAEETISLTDQFFGEDKQHLVEDFRSICAHDESLTKQQFIITKQNIDDVVRQNTAIRAEVNVVLGAMQFSEFLRQHLAGLQLSFETMINAVGKSPQQIKIDMQKKMHTFDERKAFHECIMHESMPGEDQEITQALIDQLVG